ncbi:MAG: hypothetical protein KF802_10375 [Bdellovibrionaceae bacterium]|nr:hypothetical protein [Pseudobdellovibrionaceae bacterium]
MQPIHRLKRSFYGIMGALQVIVGFMIVAAVAREFLVTGATTYGTDLPFNHPLLQTLHLVLGNVFWVAVLCNGAVWLNRARRGLEPVGA